MESREGPLAERDAFAKDEAQDTHFGARVPDKKKELPHARTNADGQHSIAAAHDHGKPKSEVPRHQAKGEQGKYKHTRVRSIQWNDHGT